MIFFIEVIMGSLFCIRAKPGREHTYIQMPDIRKGDSEKIYTFTEVGHTAKVYIISGSTCCFHNWEIR